MIKIRITEELYNDMLNYIESVNENRFYWPKLNISNFIRNLIYQEIKDHKVRSRGIPAE